MSTKQTYRVTATRSGGWWALEAPGVRRVHSQARRLDQAEAMAREAIALVLDVPEDSFDVEVEPTLSDDLAPVLEEAVAARAVAEDAQRNAREVTVTAVRRLRMEGLPVRDIGRLLGVSYQRAAKIGR